MRKSSPPHTAPLAVSPSSLAAAVGGTATAARAGQQGGHMTPIEDYEVPARRP